MEKKKGFQMPHTYIIIFGVILFAALLTVFIPLGKYDTKEITYMQNGVEKTRTVLDPESFQYILDERLAVGAKLPNEYELADRFGVSRGTIREAVKLRHYAGHRFDKRTRDPSDPDPRSPVLPRRRSLRYG